MEFVAGRLHTATAVSKANARAQDHAQATRTGCSGTKSQLTYHSAYDGTVDLAAHEHTAGSHAKVTFVVHRWLSSLCGAGT